MLKPVDTISAENNYVTSNVEKTITIDNSDYKIEFSINFDTEAYEITVSNQLYDWADFNIEDNSISINWLEQEDAISYKVYDKKSSDCVLAEIKDKTEYVYKITDSDARDEYKFYIKKISEKTKSISNDIVVKRGNNGKYTFIDIDSDTAREYVHGKTRWCLWLVGISPHELNQLKAIKERVEANRVWRTGQKKTGDAYKLKDIPHLMRPCSKFVEGPFIVLPLHTGESREYIPMGFAENGYIPGNSVSIVPNASMYVFGILCSSVHMSWMRTVCGRIKGDYRYASDIVYNTFPWCSPTAEQKKKIEETAQAILDARALYPDSSLADFYDKTSMPIELNRAHQANDKAVMEAYGFDKDMPESEIVSALMKMYQKMTEGK